MPGAAPCPAWAWPSDFFFVHSLFSHSNACFVTLTHVFTLTLTLYPYPYPNPNQVRRGAQHGPGRARAWHRVLNLHVPGRAQVARARGDDADRRQGTPTRARRGRRPAV